MCENKEKITQELADIENEICIIESLIEVVRDSCEKNDYITQVLVLEIAQKRLINITDKISLIN